MIHFEKVEVEKTIKDLNLNKLARDAGSQSPPMPHSDDVRPDANELRVVEFVVEQVQKNREQAKNCLQSLDIDRDKVETDIDKNELVSLPKEVEAELENLKTAEKNSIIEAYQAERKAKRQLLRFKADHQRTAEADYPDSSILHWSLLVAAVLAESAANSYFFSKDSDLGILGGLFQAMLISALNVGLAALSGANGLRLIYHIRPFKKLMGALWLGLNGGVLVLINLLAAHYRSQLTIDIDHAAELAVKALIASPLNITVFDAWVLFGMGLMFATLAVIEGFRSDDPYPGYGKITRVYKKTLRFSDDLRRAYLDQADQIFLESFHQIKSRTEEKRVLVRRFEQLLENSKEVINDFEQSVSANEEVCNALIEHYRDQNVQVRDKNPAPAYFEEPVYFDPKKVQLKDINFSRDEKRAAEYLDSLERIGQDRERIKEILDQRRQTFADGAEGFFQELETLAEQKIKAETNS
ncbi:MAG: hypothetical protein A2527_12610 [Candidatus Lambdaproteobacteria bacterium RIFOXYD2_FULL_50_16]|uniref:Uncharacterized protein n=1 Tax=Candidatus Lambdaproteobacteria bacterium RIFOXYD2_FULL_50_16 TaxID=1817772 RepID=A0A1F6GA76_9PROT|nr:MAG: hypothetical protein A2527_12610 [Candidatus Lambdaproteobacteria bacterium RIFOXYD2_FULL_50_16]